MFIYHNNMMNKEDKMTLDETTATQMAELFRTLSDSSRVRIIAALTTGEMSVGQLAEMVDISPSSVSHHMRH
jgi:DNA-binding transcriptional ArsR family regulator